MNNTDWKKYFFVLIITSAVFVTGVYFSNYLNDRKLAELRGMQDKVFVDILSSETRFSLLKESSCRSFETSSLLSEELSTLGARVAFMESELGRENEDVSQIKKYYSILEIKDFLLTKEMNERCKSNVGLILYFYSGGDECEDCVKQDYVLSHMQEEYAKLRIYSFDMGLNLSAISTIAALYSVKTDLPVLVVNGKIHKGFASTEDLEKLMPNLEPKSSATSTSATSTLKR